MTNQKFRRKVAQDNAKSPKALSRFAFFPAIDPFVRGDWMPRVDVSESKKEITVYAELPDINKDDIELAIQEGRYLLIKGEKQLTGQEEKEDFYLVERAFGSFERTIELPAEVDESDVEAAYRRGVLKIKMKKLSGDAKRVPIQGA